MTGHDEASLKLSAEGLLQTAIETTGLDDFGDDRYVLDYRRTIDGVNAEARFTPGGVAALGAVVQRLLVNWLRMQHDVKRHPEILEEKLAPPVFVTGLPRTGTTKMQRMLSASPAFQSITLWKTQNIAPFPDADPNGPDPRLAMALEIERMTSTAMPELWAAHPTPALEPEEDYILDEMTFLCPTIGMITDANRLADALSPMETRVYECLKLCLQYMQWQYREPRRESRPWMLKCPVHLFNLPSIQAVFPGALVVHCHRDPEVAVASIANHMFNVKQLFVEPVDRREHALSTLAYWARSWDQNIADRAKVAPETCLDIGFADINANAEQVMQRVYAAAQLKLTPSDLQAMRAWESANERHKLGKHRYSAADYNISGEEIRAAFRRYLDTFGHTGLPGTRATAE